MNSLLNLVNFGQSYWLDNITIDKILSGKLKKGAIEYLGIP